MAFERTISRRSLMTGGAALAGAAVVQGLMLSSAGAATPQPSGQMKPLSASPALLLDDFSSGPYAFSIDERDGTVSGVKVNAATGTMAGGMRWTNLDFTRNPRNQPIHLDTGSGYLHLSSGAAAFHRLEMAYGYAMQGNVRVPAPMHLDVSNHTALRLKFDPIHALVYFTVYLFSSTTDRLDYGVSFYANKPISQTYPLAGFNEVGQFDATDLNYIGMVFQGEGQFALKSIEFV